MNNNLKLHDKTVMIVGASSGIGEQIARDSAAKGANLILLARREDRLKKLKNECEHLNPTISIVVIPLDISQPEEIEMAVEKAISISGSIDYLVNSAGFGKTGEFVEQSFSTIERMFRVNVLGLMYLTQLIAIKMIEQNEGHIINIASMAGKIATPQSAIYSATKHAVLGFSNALRLELCDYNIKLTTINTGPVETEFFDRFDPSGQYKDSIKPLILSSEFVSKKTVSIFGKNKREINLPFYLNWAHKFYVFFPVISDKLTNSVFNLK